LLLTDELYFYFTKKIPIFSISNLSYCPTNSVTMKKSLVVTLLLILTIFVYGQQPETDNIIFEERFTEPGLPVGWTSTDVSNQDVFWTWCTNPTIGQVDGCPNIWEGGNNNQLPFAATTAANGFLTLDSDIHTNITNVHISQLTSSAYDFSDADTVWVKFETHIGVFNLTPNNNALFRVSKDNGASWENYNCFPEFGNEVGNPDNRWSANPKTLYFDISDVAAFESSVIFQWQWRGQFEYQWSIDDIEISDSDPRPEHDLALVEKGFLITENAIIPTFEIDAISFGATFLNQGSKVQENVQLAVEVVAESNNMLVFTDIINYGMLNIDEETDLVLFPNTFTPPAIPEVYQVQYTLIPDQPDATLEDNSRSFDFEISDTVLAKERIVLPRRSTAPLDNEWQQGQPHSWAWGNHFYIKNGMGQIAKSITFSIANAIIQNGRTINLTLFEWTDFNENNQVELEERSLVAFAEYQIAGNEPGDGFITVPLVAFPSDAAQLKDQQHYLVMLEYTTDDQTDLFINYSDNRDYATVLEYLDGQGDQRYASILGIGNPVSQTTYSSLAFGFDRSPVVRLNMDLSVSTTPTLPDEYAVTLFPNPTKDDFYVQIDFPETINLLEIKLRNSVGKLLLSEQQMNVQRSLISLSGEQLPPGVYFIEINTDIGRRVKKLIIH